jgi:hypothetical protein
MAECVRIVGVFAHRRYVDQVIVNAPPPPFSAMIGSVNGSFKQLVTAVDVLTFFDKDGADIYGSHAHDAAFVDRRVHITVATACSPAVLSSNALRNSVPPGLASRKDCEPPTNTPMERPHRRLAAGLLRWTARR